MSAVHVNVPNRWGSVLHISIPPQGCSVVYCFIGGYAQSVHTWDYLTTLLSTDPSIGTVLIARRDEERHHYVGLQSLREQIKEVESALTHLMRMKEVYGLPIVLVGHSVGALIAREVAAQHTERITGIIQIAPVPPERFALLKYWSFWLHGGLLALLMAWRGVLSTRGFIPPSLAVKGLFTGSINKERFQHYLKQLTPDSVRVFSELMLFYDGRKTWKFLKEHLHPANNTVIIAAEDTTIPRAAVERMGGRQVTLRFLGARTPHCIQFAEEANSHNKKILAEVFKVKPYPVIKRPKRTAIS